MLCHGSRVVMTVLQVSHPTLDYTGPDILVFTATTGDRNHRTNTVRASL